jgi:hypothetical protein
MPKQQLARLLLLVVTGVIVAMPFTIPEKSYAIPAFSRMYNTSCSTCHLDFPKLNDFGKAFKDAGFKFPTDDETMIKIPPVMLGAPAQVELWPHTIWPGKIPGQPPIGLRMNNFFQVTGKNRNNFQFVPGASGAPAPPFNPGSFGEPAVSLLPPKTDFETGLFSIFTAGNFGSDIAFWVDDDISVAGANSGGGLGDGYLKFVNLSRFLHMPKDSFSLRVGQFELDLPFSQARSWNISPWDIYTQANLGAVNPLAPEQFVNNGSTIADAAKGVEISGGHHYGGYWYSIAAFDQNTSGTTPSTDFVPSATGANNGGLGFNSDSNFKDIYGHLEYRFNLERNKESRHAIQAAGATGPRDHTYLSLGAYSLYGRSVQRVVGTAMGGACDPSISDLSGCVLLTAREPFYRAGADFSFNYRTFNLFGLYMHGHDHNLIPVSDLSNTPVPLPVTDFSTIAFARARPATFDGGFLQADFLAYPWLMLIMRYDAVNSHADFINGQVNALGTNFFGPVHVTRNRFTPGVQFLIHANIKASFEYQIRPQQQITVNSVSPGTNPLTGEAVAVRPFRVNTAVAGLEFVY